METKTIIWIAVLFLIAETAAQSIIIEKTAPEEVRVNETFSVNISVRNNFEDSIEIILKEIIDFAEPIDREDLVQRQNITQTDNGTVINGIMWLNPDGKCEIGCRNDGICDPDCRCTAARDRDCARFVAPITPYYEWRFTLEMNSIWNISYRVKPFGIGTIRIKPTTAITTIGEFYSNSLTVRVKCNGNGICEKGENPVNCLEDCPPDSENGICNPELDDVCDPDCEPGRDPDCIVSVCGDSKCDTRENYSNCPVDCPRPVICGDTICEKDENYRRCPDDCPSGGEDGYCDGITDGRCDPDCERTLDPDCICIKNGKCESKFRENYANCPDDCPSGREDGYCDRVKDGKCDPDCNPPELDEDCVKEDYLPYIVILLLIIVVLLIYRKFRSKESTTHD